MSHANSLKVISSLLVSKRFNLQFSQDFLQQESHFWKLVASCTRGCLISSPPAWLPWYRGAGWLMQGRTGFLESLWLVATNPPVPGGFFQELWEWKTAQNWYKSFLLKEGNHPLNCVGAADDLHIISQRCLFVSWNVDSSFSYEFSQKLLFKKCQAM